MTLIRAKIWESQRCEIFEQLLSVNVALFGVELNSEDVAVRDSGNKSIAMLGGANRRLLVIASEMIGMNVVEPWNLAHSVKQGTVFVACFCPPHVRNPFSTAYPRCIEPHSVHVDPVEAHAVGLLTSSAQQLRTQANAKDRHARFENSLIQHFY